MAMMGLLGWLLLERVLTHWLHVDLHGCDLCKAGWDKGFRCSEGGHVVQTVHALTHQVMSLLRTVSQPPPKRAVTSELPGSSTRTLSQSPEEHPQVIRYEKVMVSLAFQNFNIE